MRFQAAAGPVFAGMVAVCVAACATRPEIRTDSDPSVDLANYQTFGFFDKLATDRGSYGTILTERLKDSTRRELEQRGYQYVTSNPQLLVNFNVNVQYKQSVESTPAPGGYYAYRGGMYGMWAGYPQDIYTVDYKEGTLAIDLVDASKRQLVWQGVAQGRISHDAMENPGPAIDQVVTEVFDRYPVPEAAPEH